METPHITLGAETLFKIGPVPITNSFFMMLIVMAILLIVFSIAARKITTDPNKGGRFGSAIEMIVEFLLNLVETTGGKKLGRSVFPLVSGLFIFIICANFTGLLPGVGSIYIDKGAEATHEEDATGDHVEDTEEHQVATAAVGATSDDEGDHAATDDHAAAGEASAEGEHATAHVPIMRPPTADLNMTLALSTITFCAVQFFGVRAHGVGGRLKHMANPVFIFPIEVISEFSRIISLAARLFGNVFAGEVLLGVAYSIAGAVKIAVIPLLFPVIFLGLETLFGTIQALVFALLTLIYIFLAAGDGHGDHDDAHANAHDAHADAADPVAAGD